MKIVTYDERKVDVMAVLLVLSLVLIGMFLLSGCSAFLTPEQQSAVTQAAKDLAAGKITQEQFQAIVAAASSNATSNLNSILTQLATAAGSIISTLGIVRAWRGPAQPADAVKKA